MRRTLGLATADLDGNGKPDLAAAAKELPQRAVVLELQAKGGWASNERSQLAWSFSVNGPKSTVPTATLTNHQRGGR